MVNSDSFSLIRYTFVSKLLAIGAIIFSIYQTSEYFVNVEIISLIVYCLLWFLFYQVLGRSFEKKYIFLNTILVIIGITTLFIGLELPTVLLLLQLILVYIYYRKGRINNYFYIALIPMVLLLVSVAFTFMRIPEIMDAKRMFGGSIAPGVDKSIGNEIAFTFISFSILAFSIGLLLSKKRKLKF
jgi:hypothetical protein